MTMPASLAKSLSSLNFGFQKYETFEGSICSAESSLERIPDGKQDMKSLLGSGTLAKSVSDSTLKKKMKKRVVPFSIKAPTGYASTTGYIPPSFALSDETDESEPFQAPEYEKHSTLVEDQNTLVDDDHTSTRAEKLRTVSTFLQFETSRNVSTNGRPSRTRSGPDNRRQRLRRSQSGLIETEQQASEPQSGDLLLNRRRCLRRSHSGLVETRHQTSKPQSGDFLDSRRQSLRRTHSGIETMHLDSQPQPDESPGDRCECPGQTESGNESKHSASKPLSGNSSHNNPRRTQSGPRSGNPVDNRRHRLRRTHSGLETRHLTSQQRSDNTLDDRRKNLRRSNSGIIEDRNQTLESQSSTSSKLGKKLVQKHQPVVESEIKEGFTNTDDDNDMKKTSDHQLSQNEPSSRLKKHNSCPSKFRQRERKTLTRTRGMREAKDNTRASCRSLSNERNSTSSRQRYNERHPSPPKSRNGSNTKHSSLQRTRSYDGEMSNSVSRRSRAKERHPIKKTRGRSQSSEQDSMLVKLHASFNFSNQPQAIEMFTPCRGRYLNSFQLGEAKHKVTAGDYLSDSGVSKSKNRSKLLDDSGLDAQSDDDSFSAELWLPGINDYGSLNGSLHSHEQETKVCGSPSFSDILPSIPCL